MNREELKTILKPLIKECIKEVMFEQGVLSRVVTEVAQGMGATPAPRVAASREQEPDRDALLEEKRRRMESDRQKRKKLLDSVGEVNGVNVFEGTEPLSSGGNLNSPSPQGPLGGVDPTDAGIDISKLVSTSAGAWSALKGS